MYNSKWVKIFKSKCHFVYNLGYLIVSQSFPSWLKIVIQVTSFHIFKHYVKVFMVFKDVKQWCNVRMMAYLQNFYFFSLLKYFLWLHILLPNNLYRNFLCSLQIIAYFDCAKGTLTYNFVNFIVVLNVNLAHLSLEFIIPSILIVLLKEIEHSIFSRWDNELKRIEHPVFY